MIVVMVVVVVVCGCEFRPKIWVRLNNASRSISLKNGWTFILVERPVAPVFSFITRVNVGSAQEGAGQTGLAHMFEHMAFKGTPRIGTKNFEAEQGALVALEKAYQAYQTEKLSRKADPEKVKSLYEIFKQRQQESLEICHQK